MTAISAQKRELYGNFVADLERSGGRVLLLSGNTVSPQEYAVVSDERTTRIRVYIWKLTHDVTRDDYKFQLTGVPNNQFVVDDDAETLIVGYYPELRLYLAADALHRKRQFKWSVAIQARQAELTRANADGVAAFAKERTGEIAIVVRHDFLLTYVLNARAMHAFGEIPAGAKKLNSVVATHGDLPSAVPPERRREVVTVSRAVRAWDFGKRVLSAYGNSCAACDVQLRLIEAAHIVPVKADQGTDETSNGVSLCSLHHAAYDAGLLGIMPDYQISLKQSKVDALNAENLAGGLDTFRKALRPSIIVPHQQQDRPRVEYLREGLKIRGW